MLKVHAKKLDAVEVLALEGRIVTGHTDILRSVSQLASDSNELILDLSNVTTVDAHGLGVLLQLREQALIRGIRMELRNLNQHLYRVFEITRLHTVFSIESAEFSPAVPYAQSLPVAA